MPRYRELTRAEIMPGMQVDVCFGHRGQGGRVVDVTADGIVLTTPVEDREWFPWHRVDAVRTEDPFNLTECIEYDPDTCRGTVDYFSPRGLGGPPRCEFHVEQRLDRYEDSLERYADCALPPDWFDPADAGESWD